ncbi:MAG: hypothetical protein V9E83_04015 [Baekduia sp.]
MSTTRKALASALSATAAATGAAGLTAPAADAAQACLPQRTPSGLMFCI